MERDRHVQSDHVFCRRRHCATRVVSRVVQKWYRLHAVSVPFGSAGKIRDGHGIVARFGAWYFSAGRMARAFYHAHPCCLASRTQAVHWSGTMILRYLRLYFYFFRFSASRALEFRFDFFFRFIMDIFYYAVQIGFFKIIYTHVPLLGGWSESQMYVFMAAYFFIDALGMTFLMTNFWMLPVFINKGEIDYYITRPVSSLFFLSFREVAINSLMNLTLVIVFFMWSLWQLPQVFTLWQVLFLIFNLFIGYLIYFCIRILCVLPTFWLHSNQGLNAAFWGLVRFMERPDAIYTDWLRRILVSVIPFGIVASFPARLFLDGFNLGIFLHMITVAVLLYGVTVFLWQQGLRVYSSASS